MIGLPGLALFETKKRKNTGLISLLRATALIAVATSSALPAQGRWTCPDDGSVVVVSNQGNANVSYVFNVNVNSQYDQTHLIKITERDKDGNLVVVQTIDWQDGADVSVTLGPCRSVQIEVPATRTSCMEPAATSDRGGA